MSNSNHTLPDSGVTHDSACNSARELSEDLDTLRDNEMLERMKMQLDLEEARMDNADLKAKADALTESLRALSAYYARPYRPCGSELAELVLGLLKRGYIFIPDLAIESLR